MFPTHIYVSVYADCSMIALLHWNVSIHWDFSRSHAYAHTAFSSSFLKSTLLARFSHNSTWVRIPAFPTAGGFCPRIYSSRKLLQGQPNSTWVTIAYFKNLFRSRWVATDKVELRTISFVKRIPKAKFGRVPTYIKEATHNKWVMSSKKPLVYKWQVASFTPLCLC